MALTPITVDELRDRLDVLEVLSNYLRLDRAGTEYRSLCPFHDDHRPSFYVNAEKGVWLCRVENIGGDVFDFVQKIENLDFQQAAELLANRLGCTIARGQADAGRADERSRLLEVCRVAAELYERALWQSEAGRPAREYLDGRGIDEATARWFRLGYAPGGWDKLVARFERDGINLRDAETAGLIKARERGGGYYDRFRHRLMFPILDRQGRCVGFGGRVLNPEDEPKYLNSAESPVFSKGRLLYAPPGRIEQLEDGILVVEGYMDVIALWQHGVANVCATLGTALTPEHLKLLRRQSERVTLCYDADRAGARATDRAAAMFVEQGLDGRVLSLPDGLDPDEFVRRDGADALRAMIAAAPDVIEYRLTTALAGASEDPAHRAEVVRETVVAILGDIRDELRAAAVTQHVAAWWAAGTPGLQESLERTLTRALRDRRRGAGRSRAGESGLYRQRQSRAYYTERQFLSRLLREPESLDRLGVAVEAGWFGDPACRRIFEAWRAQPAPRDAQRLMGELPDAGRALVAEILCGELDDPSVELARLVNDLQMLAVESELERLRRERTATDDPARAAELQRKIRALKQKSEQARIGGLPPGGGSW